MAASLVCLLSCSPARPIFSRGVDFAPVVEFESFMAIAREEPTRTNFRASSQSNSDTFWAIVLSMAPRFIAHQRGLRYELGCGPSVRGLVVCAERPCSSKSSGMP